MSHFKVFFSFSLFVWPGHHSIIGAVTLNPAQTPDALHFVFIAKCSFTTPVNGRLFQGQS